MSIIGIDLGSSFADLALLKDGAVKTAKVACDGLAAGEAILTALDGRSGGWRTVSENGGLGATFATVRAD